MNAYCRGCNRDFAVEGEEYQEYWKEKKTGQLHPKIDCDVEEGITREDMVRAKALLDSHDLPENWGRIKEEVVDNSFSAFDPRQNPMRDEVRSHYGKLKGDALPKKKKTATVVGDNTQKR